MKSLKLMLPVATLLVTGITVKAQTADEVINKHIDAAGGKDKLSQVKTVHIEGTSDAGGAVAINTVVGKNYKSESEYNGSPIIQCYSDHDGWSISPMGGGATAMPDDQYKVGADQVYPDALLDYAGHGAKVELLGTEGDDYKIKYTNKYGSETTYYINKTTYYTEKVVKTLDFNGNSMDLIITLSDFKPTDFGNVMPNTIKTDVGTFFSSTATVKKIEVNKDIDPKIFEMPK